MRWKHKEKGKNPGNNRGAADRENAFILPGVFFTPILALGGDRAEKRLPRIPPSECGGEYSPDKIPEKG